MRRIAYELYTGYAGVSEEDVIEVPDDMTDDAIQAMVDEMAMEWAQSWEGDSRLGWDYDEMSEEEYDDHTQHFYEGVGGTWRDEDETD